jgi:hypothetical protein
MYKITIKDNFSKKELYGEFNGNMEEAISEAKDFYAEALDTTKHDIEVVRIEKIS